jgi:TolA-binding protein
MPSHRAPALISGWLDAFDKRLGPAYYQLGKRYFRQRRFVDAARLFADAEVRLAQKLDPGHPHVVAAIVNLAASYAEWTSS